MLEVEPLKGSMISCNNQLFLSLLTGHFSIRRSPKCQETERHSSSRSSLKTYLNHVRCCVSSSQQSAQLPVNKCQSNSCFPLLWSFMECFVFVFFSWPWHLPIQSPEPIPGSIKACFLCASSAIELSWLKPQRKSVEYFKLWSIINRKLRHQSQQGCKLKQAILM